jgi:hypothetical protein
MKFYQTTGISAAIALQVNLGSPVRYSPVAAAYVPASAQAIEPTPYVPSLTYVGGIAYNDHA